MKKITSICILGLLAATAGLTGCKKLIEISAPENQLVTSSVFTDSMTAEAAVDGMYSKAANGYPQSDMGTATTFYNALSADEGYYFPFTSYDPFTQNAYTPTYIFIDNYWISMYGVIYSSNSLMQGDSTSSLPLAYRTRTTGEAKFMRALCYFYLVNEYGAVPLVLSTNVQTTTSQPRDSVNTVYDQIEKDLTDAIAELPSDFSYYGGNKTRATTWAAKALLARVYLYRSKWAQAESMASAVIDNAGLFSLVTDLTKVFLAGSSEGILQYVPALTSAWTASTMCGSSTATTPYFVLSDSLYAAFETGDLRAASWVKIKVYNGINYPCYYKYHYVGAIGSVENAQVLRLSEQYLIRAEARMQQGAYADAAADINVVRARAGLANTTANDKASLVTAIEHENRIEFFAELGHRWLDMKRWPGIANPSVKRADEVYPVDKTTPWQSYLSLYPIPQTELNANVNLNQNPGY